MVERIMRTLIIIIAGFALLAVGVLAARSIAGKDAMVVAAKGFLAVWLAVALTNMWIGVSRAGYSVREELPVFLVIFLLPACAAIFVWWKLSR